MFLDLLNKLLRRENGDIFTDFTVSSQPELQSIEDYNKSKLLKRPDPYCTGIACPVCEAELQFPDPNMVLLSHPPKKNVRCPKCQYRGFVLA